MFISSYGNGNKKLYNYALYNNNDHFSGGGEGKVFIDSYKEGSSIEFQNCTIYNNTPLSVKANGIGIYINLSRYGNSTIEFHNCTIYNNNAQYISGKRKSVH